MFLKTDLLALCSRVPNAFLHNLLDEGGNDAAQVKPWVVLADVFQVEFGIDANLSITVFSAVKETHLAAVSRALTVSDVVNATLFSNLHVVYSPR